MGVSDTMAVHLGFSLVGRPMWSWCGGSLDKEGAKRIAEHFKQIVGEAVGRALADPKGPGILSNNGMMHTKWVLGSPINARCWLEWRDIYIGEVKAIDDPDSSTTWSGLSRR